MIPWEELGFELIGEAADGEMALPVLLRQKPDLLITDIKMHTGVVIADYFKDRDYEAVPAVLFKNHGPFTWGKDAHEAVHNAAVLEEVAKMAARCEMINPNVKPAPQDMQDKHYYRKHGENAYYGQGNAQ